MNSTFVNTAVQVASVTERDLERRFAHLLHTLHTRTTQRGARPATQSTPAPSTYLPQRPVDPSQPHAQLVSSAHTCQCGQPTVQVGVAASHAAREVLQAQETPASERRVTPVAPLTRDGRERQDESDEAS